MNETDLLFSQSSEWDALRRHLSTDDRQSLLGLAKAFAAQRPPSVTDKARPAPSGNPNDYHSLGIYWWPDPDRPDGTPYIRRDGEVNPEVRHFDRPLLARMVQGVSTLILQGWAGADSDYFDLATRWLRVWFIEPDTRMNPHLMYAQHIPGICEGRDIGLIETQDLVFLLELLPILAGSGRWPEEEQNSFRAWIADYLYWFRNSNHGRGEEQQHNNHGMWYDLQVMAYARFSGDTAVVKSQWSRHSRERILTQVTSNGEQPHEDTRTLSLNYNVFNLTAVTGILLICRETLEELPAEPVTRCLNSLRRLLPAMEKPAIWPHPQIKPFESPFPAWLCDRIPRKLPGAEPLNRCHPFGHTWSRLAPLVGYTHT